MEYRSSEIDKLAAALAKAQAGFKPVGVDRKVSIPTRDGKTYSYDYATLSAIWEVIRKPLSDNGLSISQPIIGDELQTILMHESGQFIISTISLPSGGDIKNFGANISYVRRYALAPLVGVAVGEEDDESVATGSVDLKSSKSKPESPKPTNGNGHKLTRPMSPEQIKNAAAVKAAKATGPASDTQLDYADSSLSKAVNDDDAKHHAITEYLFGFTSLKNATTGQCSFLIDWIGAKKENEYTPEPDALKEIEAILRQIQIEAGQVDMFSKDEIPF